MVFSALVFLHNILHIHIRFTLVVASVALPDMNDCLTVSLACCKVPDKHIFIAYCILVIFNVFAEFVKV